jgi:hypothetical protein
MEITFGYEIIGTYPVTIDIDEEELQEDGWDEMTEEERINYLTESYEYSTMHRAECECEFSIGSLDYISIDEEEHWMH